MPGNACNPAAKSTLLTVISIGTIVPKELEQRLLRHVLRFAVAPDPIAGPPPP